MRTLLVRKKNCLEPKIARRQLRRHILRIIIISSFSKLHLFLRTILALADFKAMVSFGGLRIRKRVC